MSERLEEIRKNTCGVVVALNTPFKDDFTPNLDGMRQDVEKMIDAGIVNGVGILLTCGGGGEIAFLTSDEIVEYVKVAAGAAKGRAPIMAGVYEESVHLAREQARRLEDAGADSLQIGPPRFPGLTVDDFVRFYEGVASAVSIGISVYNTHWYTRLMEAEDMLRLAAIDNVVAVKWGHPNYQAFLAGVGKLAPHIRVLDNQVSHVASHSLGAVGYISTTGPWWPAYEVDIVKALQSRDYVKAQDLITAVVYPFRRYMADLTPKTRKGGYGLFKAAGELCGMSGGLPRPPCAPLNAEEIEDLRQFMLSLGAPVIK